MMTVPNLPALPGMATGRTYKITYRSLDLGYGVETGRGTYTYDGPFDTQGKHKFTPAGGGEPVYLFAEEITTASLRS